ncbi:unnamed protein product [Calicophoron daubneyi]
MSVDGKKLRTGLRVATDLFIVIMFHLSYFIIKSTGHPRVGFFCEDDSIRYPFNKETITTLQAALYGYLFPLLLVIVVELLFSVYQKFHEGEMDAVKKSWLPIYNYCIAFLVAAGACFMITTILKYTLGRLRPHFLAACEPDIPLNQCTGYQSNYVCRSTNTKAVENAYLSFVSGHSSAVSVGVVFSVLYMQKRLNLTLTPMLRPMLQFILIGTCLYVGYSRVSDYMHHPTDVVGGLLLGTVCAVFVFFCYIGSPSDLI